MKDHRSQIIHIEMMITYEFIRTYLAHMQLIADRSYIFNTSKIDKLHTLNFIPINFLYISVVMVLSVNLYFFLVHIKKLYSVTGLKGILPNWMRPLSQ